MPRQKNSVLGVKGVRQIHDILVCKVKDSDMSINPSVLANHSRERQSKQTNSGERQPNANQSGDHQPMVAMAVVGRGVFGKWCRVDWSTMKCRGVA